MACVTCNKNINVLESIKSLNDSDFILVYAKKDADYNGDTYNYGTRTKGEAFYILDGDNVKNVSKTPIVVEPVVIESEVTNETSTE